MSEMHSPMWLAWGVVLLISDTASVLSEIGIGLMAQKSACQPPFLTRTSSLGSSVLIAVPLISPVRSASRWSNWLWAGSGGERVWTLSAKLQGWKWIWNGDALNFLKNTIFSRRQCYWICILLLSILPLLLWGPCNCSFNMLTRTLRSL